MTGTGVGSDDARRAVALVCDETVGSVRAVEGGINDTFVASGSDQLVCKFATYSRPRSLRAGVVAYRLLELYTDLPVPTVYGIRTDPSVVVTDFGPSNLLAPNGGRPGNGTVGELTGVLDLERAKIGPVGFTAVNAEYLLTRGVNNPGPLVEALYDPLPFGPDLPRRDLYRLVALGRSVGALDLWYEVGSEEHRRRGDAVAAELERRLD
jgi:hypothetical protein